MNKNLEKKIIFGLRYLHLDYARMSFDGRKHTGEGWHLTEKGTVNLRNMTLDQEKIVWNFPKISN